MSELKENQLVFVREDGTEELCEIIFTYDSPEFKKNYVFFAPIGSEDEEGRVEVQVASYTPTNGEIGELQEVETEEEWNMLEDVFASFAEEDECDCEECDCDECDCEEEEDHCCCCHHHHDEEE